MKEKNFKTLMYGNKYVNQNLLKKGIYSTSIPSLYGKDETMETLVEKHNKTNDIMRSTYYDKEFFENLKQCQLVSIVLIGGLIK